MSRRSIVLASSLIIAAACTQDYDTFDFASGGGAATGGNGASSAGGAGTGPGGAGTGAAAGSGATGAETSTTSTGGEGGMGGMPATIEVPCGRGGTCDVSAGDACCVPQAGATDGTCDPNCTGSEASLECNQPSDCPPGDSCCLVYGGSNYDRTQCKGTCGGNDDVICDPQTFEPCNIDECLPVADLPVGFRTCQ